jgi:hypothetical protein
MIGFITTLFSNLKIFIIILIILFIQIRTYSKEFCSFLMEPRNSCWVFRFFIILLTFLLNPSPSSSWSLHPSHINSMAMHRNHTAISDFRLLNRRTLMECSNATDPSIKIKVSRKSNLADEEYLLSPLAEFCILQRLTGSP